MDSNHIESGTIDVSVRRMLSVSIRPESMFSVFDDVGDKNCQLENVN